MRDLDLMGHPCAKGCRYLVLHDENASLHDEIKRLREALEGIAEAGTAHALIGDDATRVIQGCRDIARDALKEQTDA